MALMSGVVKWSNGINPLILSRMGQYSRVIDTVDNVTKECLRYDQIKMDAHSILFV